ncbi:DUF1801 domain-containing protein [Seonamhaeicola sp.]|uniref:DUF1801 domain-containing protein n=1 Tax=Seonamhaeicola sp. TaxID=1912245 RepID=UPI0026371068|nr:DUF1801 domain-containing protein [Seonamhaeicola sp.]
MNQKEPFQSIMLYVRSVIVSTLPDVVEKYNYGIPFYHYNGKPFIYLNILKRTNFVDVAFVRGVILKKQFPQLRDYNNRKNVRSLQYTNLDAINEQELSEIIKAAAKLMDTNRKA